MHFTAAVPGKKPDPRGSVTKAGRAAPQAACYCRQPAAHPDLDRSAARPPADGRPRGGHDLSAGGGLHRARDPLVHHERQVVVTQSCSMASALDAIITRKYVHGQSCA